MTTNTAHQSTSIPCIEDKKPIDGKIYMAYIRKSTAGNKKQKGSFLEQKTEIHNLALAEGLNPNKDIIYYQESGSGFKIEAKRRGFEKMIEDIKKSKYPVILFAYDETRMARNRRADTKIMDLLQPSHNKKPKIEKIIMQGKTWDPNTPMSVIVGSFNNAEQFSLSLSEKAEERKIGYLQRGQWRHAPTPLGFINVKETGGRLTEDPNTMPHVKKAFEMKSEGKSNREISEYLKGNGIQCAHKNGIAFLRNTIYIGEYTTKKGEFYDDFQFTKRKPPIKKELFNKVQAMIAGKARGRKYRNKKDRDIFEEVGRTESGLILSRDIKTKKSGKVYTYYKNSKDGISISRNALIRAFVEKYKVMITGLYKQYMILSLQRKIDDLEDMRSKDPHEKQEYMSSMAQILTIIDPEGGSRLNQAIKEEDISYQNECIDIWIQQTKEELRVLTEKKGIEDISMEEVKSSFFHIFGKEKENTITKIPDEINHKLHSDDARDKLIKGAQHIHQIYKSAHEEFYSVFESALERINPQDKKIKKMRKDIIKGLHNDISRINEEKKEIQKRALEMSGITNDALEEILKEKDDQISEIQNEIENLSDDDNFTKFLKRAPGILAKIAEISLNVFGKVELSSNSHSKAEEEDWINDLSQLIKITKSNYIVDNKKTLTIGISEVLETLIFDEESLWYPQ